MAFYLSKPNHCVTQTCLSVCTANIPYTKHKAVLQHSPLFNGPLLLFSLKLSKPVTLGPGLTGSDSERCCFSPTRLENDPSVSQQVDLFLLRGSYRRACADLRKHRLGLGEIYSQEKKKSSLRGHSEQSTRRIKGPQKTARNPLFKLPLKLSMTLVGYRNSICLPRSLSFRASLFQQLANMGGIWKRAWKKKKRLAPLRNPPLLIGQTDAQVKQEHISFTGSG